MTDQTKRPGTIGWLDLSVDNADEIRDFYKSVVGWTTSDVSMGEYNDYCMHPPESDPVGGICHKRGSNADLPSAWLVYINVADLDESIRNCERLGGKLISGPKSMSGYGRYCVIEDPAGAVAALFEPET